MNSSEKKRLEEEIERLEKELQNVPSDLEAGAAELSLRQANLHKELGLQYEKLGAYDQAIEHFEQVISFLNHHEPDPKTQSEIFYYLGKSYLKSEQFELALNTFRQALDAGDLSLRGQILSQIAHLFLVQEEWEKALQFYNEAEVELLRHSEDKALGTLNWMRGLVYYNLQDYAPALKGLETADNFLIKAEAYEDLSRLHQVIRSFVNQTMGVENRRAYWEKARDISQQSQKKLSYGYFSMSLGLWYQEESKPREALEYVREALQIMRDHQLDFEVADLCYFLGSLEEELGDPRKATYLYMEALEKMLATGHYEHTGMTVLHLQGSEIHLQNEEEAQQLKQLLKEASSEGFGEELWGDEEDTVIEGKGDWITHTQLAENISEVASQYSERSVKELQEDFQELKSKLPEKPEEFMQVAQLLLEKAYQSVQNSWFNRKKKRKAFEDIQKEVQDTLLSLQSKEDFPSDWKNDLQDLINHNNSYK